mmetsp:Transcript_22036/g.46135  ORF Transcript_22036/g.46135 Transcript_22036/m.46135 type:complete len:85 (+) Transcript_22036:1158-1412(+)
MTAISKNGKGTVTVTTHCTVLVNLKTQIKIRAHWPKRESKSGQFKGPIPSFRVQSSPSLPRIRSTVPKKNSSAVFVVEPQGSGV